MINNDILGIQITLKFIVELIYEFFLPIKCTIF